MHARRTGFIVLTVRGFVSLKELHVKYTIIVTFFTSCQTSLKLRLGDHNGIEGRKATYVVVKMVWHILFGYTAHIGPRQPHCYGF